MTIIKSIESGFTGVTFPINGTNYHARINGSIMTGIIYIEAKGEAWLETTDIRMMTCRLDDINRLADILNTIPYLVVDYDDLHGYIDLDGVLYNVNSEYTYIDKRHIRELTGGEYRADQTIESIQE